MPRRWAYLWLLVALLLAGCGEAKSFFSERGSKSSEPATTGPDAPPIPSVLAQPQTARTALVDMSNRPMSFAPVVAAADGSVATVRSVGKQRVAGRDRTRSEGLGTAFVYDPAGFLLTNHHVIEGGDEITVAFADGRRLLARVAGSDKRTDVAVLKVDATDLVPLPLGDSDEILVGDWVVAIGNPFGLNHTVSAGILSAKGRTSDDVKGLDPTGYFNFLQTDASINPGNSGGPLLNTKGEVVGINAAIRANANSIGFAIPINMVKQLLPMLLRDGKIRRSAIGVIVADLQLDQAGRLGVVGTKGAWVKAIQRSGPAEVAGIEVDDVIVGFEGSVVADPNALRWYASIFGVGRTATVRVARGSKVFDVKVTLGELPEQDQ